jgi:RNA-binding protein
MDEKLKKLRSQGTITKPAIIMGKNGLTEQMITNIKNELKKSTIVKIKILPTFVENKDKKKIVDDIVERTNSKLVQSIGFTVVVTRR